MLLLTDAAVMADRPVRGIPLVSGGELSQRHHGIQAAAPLPGQLLVQQLRQYNLKLSSASLCFPGPEAPALTSCVRQSMLTLLSHSRFGA
jgi:hypothetical protein